MAAPFAALAGEYRLEYTYGCVYIVHFFELGKQVFVIFEIVNISYNFAE